MTSSPPALSPLSGDTKRSYVRQMFTAIAPRYDLLNHVLSLNVDRGWRRRAVDRMLGARPDSSMGVYLDLCAGTLDLSLALTKRTSFRGRVVGADFVIPMLQLGRAKCPDGANVSVVGADALELPFPDARFDGCMVGFGIRNLADLDRGLDEMRRVLKPGGRLVILDFAIPDAQPVKSLYLFYFRHVLPHVGRLVSKHTTAYSYLPDSVSEFPSPERLAARMTHAGLNGVGFERLTFGIAALWWGDAAKSGDDHR
ncbi:MAG TPA: bifunctional demethylmenaquinone methyltransferase/2-methoxy-6-polyprenyl-1,4-benzoquinol methylase UbiE [Gemmatimonadales bacterium]|nr:bifunctional demethylmenaquinone methyltransferase/2-methoxy-6-polyprenyl-1,4-benzoquinol methylase UbiE [Gemmatimonadales bacterium]